MLWTNQILRDFSLKCVSDGYPMLHSPLDPVSIFDKTSYRKISQSLKAARFVFRIMWSLWNLTGTSAALLPMCQSNFIAMRWSNYQSRGFETSRDLTVRRLIGYWNGALVYPVCCVIVRNCSCKPRLTDCLPFVAVTSFLYMCYSWIMLAYGSKYDIKPSDIRIIPHRLAWDILIKPPLVTHTVHPQNHSHCACFVGLCERVYQKNSPYNGHQGDMSRVCHTSTRQPVLGNPITFIRSKSPQY